MRSMVVVMVLASTAFADKRLDDLATGYDREAAACKRQESGFATVLAGARTLPDVQADVERLDKGHAVVAGYCGELDGALALIKGATSYKAVEHELDERDNKIRRARAASKKVVTELEPVMHRLIPLINAAHAGAPQVAEHRTPAKFPSGRAVELPALPGQWTLSGTASTDVATYADKAVAATITAQPFKVATCDQERRRLAGIDGVSELEVPAAAKQLGVAWMVSYSKSSQLVALTCAQVGTGGAVAIVETSEPKLIDELHKLALRMIGTVLTPR